jgi:tetratricopeptide (TPR) repeat protein
MKVDGFCRSLVVCTVLVVLCCAARAQCGPAASTAGATGDEARIQQCFEEKNWTEVVRLAEAMSARSADVNFEYGMALAHLQQWEKARAALIGGERECPREKRFDEELAGIAFEQKRYPEAAAWLRRGLRIDPRDEYENNFAGTVYLLMGNVNAALKYWNRVGKPYVGEVRFDPHLKVQRLVLDRALAFSPEAVMKEREFETTQARVDGLGIFSRYNVGLNAREDGKFGAEFNGVERDGFGSSWVEALVSTFGGGV